MPMTFKHSTSQAPLGQRNSQLLLGLNPDRTHDGKNRNITQVPFPASNAFCLDSKHVTSSPSPVNLRVWDYPIKSVVCTLWLVCAVCVDLTTSSPPALVHGYCCR